MHTKYQTHCSTCQRIRSYTSIQVQPGRENLQHRTLRFAQNQLEQTMLVAQFDERGSCSDACPFSTVAEFNATVPARNDVLNLQQRDISAQSCPVCYNFPNLARVQGRVHCRDSGSGPVCPACGLEFDLESDSALRRHRNSRSAAQECCRVSECDWTQKVKSRTAQLDSDIETMWDDCCGAADALPVKPVNQVPETTL
jgi:hypothetical protein